MRVKKCVSFIRQLIVGGVKQLHYQTCNAYHFVSSADEDGNSSGVLAFFNDEHAVFSCPEADFPHQASAAQFLCSQFAESGHDAAAGGDGNQLDQRNEFL